MQTETTPATEITADAQLVLEALTRLGGAAFDATLSAESYVHVGVAYATALRCLVCMNLVERVCVEPGSDNDLIIATRSRDAAAKALVILAQHSRKRHLKPVREALVARVTEIDAAASAARYARESRLERAELELVTRAHSIALRLAPTVGATARVATERVSEYEPRFRVSIGRGCGGMIDGLVELTVEIDRAKPLRDRLTSFEAGQLPTLRVSFRAASASGGMTEAAAFAVAWTDAAALANTILTLAAPVVGAWEPC